MPDERVAQAEVPGTEDVGPAQREHQEHLGRPAPDAPDLGQSFYDLLVIESCRKTKNQISGINA